VEAALMRRAGYEARVLPIEDGSYEDNPPTLLDFSARDLRWCQGNMQYWRLLALPGLPPMSRFQLAWAILMFLGVPAMTLMVALLPLKLLDGEDRAAFPAGLAAGVYLAYLLMYLAPKLAGVADVLLRPGGARAYGGAGRFLSGALTETAFSFLLGAVSTFRTTVFMAGLALGRSVVWNGQARDARGVPWATAARALWAPTLFGVAVCGALAWLSPVVLLWSLPLTLGYLAAIPFTVATASPAAASLFARLRLCAIPEELDPAPGDRDARERDARERDARAAPAMSAPLAAAVGRSLRIYHGDPSHRAALDRLYARFVRPGDLVLDVGAHVGDRSPPSGGSGPASWRWSPSRDRRARCG
jgi:membrane glycosyltransferase